MHYSLRILFFIVVLVHMSGCSGDREHPTPTTESDRLMESYLANVDKIGSLLESVENQQQAQAVSTDVLLIVEDMRTLIPKMNDVDEKEQADTMSKYRVKIRKVNERFAENVKNFVAIPGAGDDLIRQLKSLPSFTD